MVFVDRYAVLAELAEQRPAPLSGPKPSDQLRARAQWDVDRPGGAVDHVEALRHGLEGEQLRANLGQNTIYVLRFRPLQLQQRMEVGLDRLPGGDVVILLQHHAARADGGLEQRRRGGLPPEKGDDALRDGALALPVAPAGGLEDGVQARLFPEHGGKVHIHPGLNQGGGDHPAGEPLPEPAADLLQLGAPVGGIHEGREVKVPLAGEPRKDLLGALAAVDNAEHLLVLLELSGQCIPVQPARLAEAHPAEGFRGTQLRRTELHCRTAGQKLRKERPQCGLGGGTEDGGCAIMLNQLGDGVDAWPQAGKGEQLGLVEEDDASSQIVELAALGGAVGIEGFKELHRRGHHHGHVPVLRGLGQADRFWSGLGVDFIGGVGVVLQHVLRPKDGSELLGGLLDDGGVGDHIDDPPQSPGPSLGQGEGQRGHRLSAPGGDGEGKQAGGLGFAHPDTLLQNGAAAGVQLSLRGKPAGDMALEPLPKVIQRSGVLRPGGAVHKGLGVQEIRVRQTGKQHPGKEHQGQRLRAAGGRSGGGEGDLFRPGGAVGQHAPFRALHPSQKGSGIRGVPLSASVREAAVVSRRRKGGERLPHTPAGKGAGGGVIHLGAAGKAALKFHGVFSEVVAQAGQPTQLLRAKGSGKEGATLRRPVEVLRRRLFPAVAGNVGQIGHGKTTSVLKCF